MPVKRVDVLGVPVDVVSEADVLAFVDDRVMRSDPAQIVTVNAEFVMIARRLPDFAVVLCQADMSTPDGAGVVWAMRRAGAKQVGRVGGSDLIWSISQQAARRKQRVFLLGAAEGVAKVAGDVLTGHYPGLDIVGTHSGTPSAADERYIVDLIRCSGADILFVAFGAPAQDIWIARNLPSTGVAVAIGVGGSFDYVAGRTRRAPRWMRDHGLDWLWRLILQPWRWRRMLALPAFAWAVLREDRPGLPAKG